MTTTKHEGKKITLSEARQMSLDTLEKHNKAMTEYMRKELSDLAEPTGAGMREICLCAAVKTADGKVFPGRRHGHCLTGIWFLEKNTQVGSEQGFLTNLNRFVTRKEGRVLQEAAGIPSADPEGYRYDTLFSEDLY